MVRERLHLRFEFFSEVRVVMRPIPILSQIHYYDLLILRQCSKSYVLASIQFWFNLADAEHQRGNEKFSEMFFTTFDYDHNIYCSVVSLITHRHGRSTWASLGCSFIWSGGTLNSESQIYIKELSSIQGKNFLSKT